MSFYFALSPSPFVALSPSPYPLPQGGEGSSDGLSFSLLPLSFGERGGVRGLLESLLNNRQHTLHILQNFIVPKTYHTIACALKKHRATLICFKLVCMLTAIKFNDEPRSGAQKINNIRSFRDLTAKLGATDLTVSQVPPQAFFSLGLIVAKITRARCIFLNHFFLSTPPHPALSPKGERVLRGRSLNLLLLTSLEKGLCFFLPLPFGERAGVRGLARV